jgi:hypothetical protein
VGSPADSQNKSYATPTPEQRQRMSELKQLVSRILFTKTDQYKILNDLKPTLKGLQILFRGKKTPKYLFREHSYHWRNDSESLLEIAE